MDYTQIKLFYTYQLNQWLKIYGGWIFLLGMKNVNSLHSPLTTHGNSKKRLLKMCWINLFLQQHVYIFPNLFPNWSDFWRWISREFGPLDIYRYILCLCNRITYSVMYCTLWGQHQKNYTYKCSLKWKPTRVVAQSF